MTFDADVGEDVGGTSASLAGEPAGSDVARRWRQRLRGVVARSVVPRLATRGTGAQTGMPPESLHDRAIALARLAVTAGIAGTAPIVETWLAEGLDFEGLFEDVLAPAARHLGELWLTDELTFLDVTRGTAVLQAVLRRHVPAFEAEVTQASGKSILVAPVPGEQHVFGPSMLAAFFRRAGWHVVFEPAIDEAGLLTLVRTQAFDAVALSAAGTRFARRAPGLIAQLRAASATPDLRVLAGGAAFGSEAGDVGADAMAQDAAAAVRLAEALTRAPRSPSSANDGCRLISRPLGRKLDTQVEAPRWPSPAF